MCNDTKKISKFLSLVLRHKPEEIQLQLDPHGWASIKELIARAAANGKILTISEIREVVSSSDKQRFTISEDGESIRANQGHSIEIDLQLPVTTPPDILYHGTATRFLDSILKEGLIRGNRHHVHLSAACETALAVGKRHGRPVILVVRSGEMFKNGISFYISKNNVWLCDSVPSNYLSVME